VMELNTDNMSDDSAFVIDLDGTTLDVKFNKTDEEITVSGGENDIERTVDAEGTVGFDVTGERLAGKPVRFGWPEFGSNSEIGIEDGGNGVDPTN